MEYITSFLNNPPFAALVNSQIFAAVLLALLVYRFVAPIIDLINPVFILIYVTREVKTFLLRLAAREKRDTEFQEQIGRWQRGELVGKWEPCISGHGEALVIEPKLGHKIIIQRREQGEP